MTVRVDVWSDIACPWCWVGKRNLAAAIESFDGDVDLAWHAFELNPSAPAGSPESVDYVGRLAGKYQTTRDQAQAMIDRMVGAGAEAGLEFRFDRVRPANTFDAHRLIASLAGDERQTAVVERLFRAYMTEGAVISDGAVLVDLAVDVGVDADAAQAVVSTDARADTVRADERRAAQLGVSGVPFFAIAGRYAVSGAQPAAVLRGALERAAGDWPGAASAGETCDRDSCG